MRAWLEDATVRRGVLQVSLGEQAGALPAAMAPESPKYHQDHGEGSQVVLVAHILM